MTLDTSIIIKNIEMLDHNTISIKNLTNKFCVMLSQMGYERTTELENSISDIVTKYKEKEISEDQFVSLFNDITTPTSTNTNTSSNTSGSTNGNSDNNTNRTNDPRTTGRGNTDENTSRIDRNNANTNTNSSSETGTTGTSTNGTNTPKQNNATGASTGNVVEIDTDTTEAATADLQNVEATIESATLEVPAKVEEFAPTLHNDAETAKENVNTEITELKVEIVEAVNTVIEVDDGIQELSVGQSLKDIVATAYDLSQNRATQRATEEFFRNGGCTIDGNFAIMTVDGNECKYDMKKHKFYVNGKESFEAYFYVPSGVTDYSKCNTYTCFVENSTNYKDLLDSRSTNCVILKIVKPGGQNKYTKYDETAIATKFTNKVANTDLTNCQNAIGGDSVYGAHSLKIAARNGDLYQTVYCINNAALVTDVNARRNNKEQFNSIEELQGLDGKNIYFISASGDDNLAAHFGRKGAMTGCSYAESYTYTGVDLVCKTCPNAKVHAIYQPSNAKQEGIADLYTGLESKYSNFSYDREEWDTYARKRYATHSQGNIIVSDLAEAPATNANNYNT